MAQPEPTGSDGIIAIKTCMPEAGRPTRTGDWHFGASLAAAFGRRGRVARVDEIGEWASAPATDVVDLVIQGHDYHPPRPGIPCFMWLIYPGKRFDLARLADYRHVFVASRVHARKLRRRFAGARISYLPQAFDSAIMHPPARGAARQGIVFVGNNHFGRPRPVVAAATGAGADLSIWGAGWEGTPQEANVRGAFVANQELGDVYRGAEIVLCDHTNVMSRNGYLSNRVYDVLACATPIILDGVAGMPEEFLPFVKIVSSPDEFAAAVAEIRAEGPEQRAARRAFARKMVRQHSFDARARHILKVISQRQAETAS